MPVEKALSYDDEERVGFRRGGRGGGSRRGGGRRGGRGGGGRRGSRRGGGGARRGSRSPRGNRARAARNKAKRARDKTKTAERQGFGQFARKQKNIVANKTVTPTKKTVTPTKKVSTPSQRQPGLEKTKSQKAAQDAYNKRTGFQTKGGGFLKDSKGNIVRSKTQVQKVADERARERALRKVIAPKIQAGEAKQVTPTVSGMENRLKQLRDQLGKGQQTPENLRQLVSINRSLGDFDYAGMGIGNQLRTQGADLVKGIPGLAKAVGFVANPLASVASAALTGGKGILGAGQNVLAGLTGKQPLTNLGGQFADAFKSLRLGEDTKALDPRDSRGGRQDERMMAQMLIPPTTRPMAPPMQPTPIPTATGLATGSGLGLDRLQEIYQLPRMMAQDGGRVHMGHGGMMMSESPTVIMNVANSGIGGILDKFKQIRSEM